MDVFLALQKAALNPIRKADLIILNGANPDLQRDRVAIKNTPLQTKQHYSVK